MTERFSTGNRAMGVSPIFLPSTNTIAHGTASTESHDTAGGLGRAGAAAAGFETGGAGVTGGVAATGLGAVTVSATGTGAGDTGGDGLTAAATTTTLVASTATPARPHVIRLRLSPV